jgi:hypothetical protein
MPAKAKLTTRSISTSTVSSDNLNKGSELTFNEADSNFLNLRDQTFAITDGSTASDVTAGQTITVTGTGGIAVTQAGRTVTIDGSGVAGGGSATGLTFVGDDSTGTLISDGETIKIAGGTGITTAISGDTLTITATGGGGSANLGNLQVNDTTLSPITTNDDLKLQANASGRVIVNAIGIDLEGAVRVGSSSLNGDIRNYNVGKYMLVGSNNGQAGAYTQWTNAGSIINKLNGPTATYKFDSLTGSTSGAYSILEIGIPSAGPTITALQGYNGVDGLVADQNLTLSASGTGKVILSGLSYPNTDGTAGQVLSTDGAGQLSFTTVSAGSTGDITFSGNNISTTSSNANLELDPAGTGSVRVLSTQLIVGPGNSYGAITSAGNEQLEVSAEGGGGTVARIVFHKVSDGGDINIQPKSTTGRINFTTATSTTVGANGAASALTALPVGYLKIKINGSEFQIPYYNT